MKALLTPPSRAAAIAAGDITIEPRYWSTPYRGELLIVAGTAAGPNARGEAICVVRLVDCRQMVPADAKAAGRAAFDGARVFVLADPRRVPPVGVGAELLLYDVPDLLVGIAEDIPAPSAPAKPQSKSSASALVPASLQAPAAKHTAPAAGDFGGLFG